VAADDDDEVKIMMTMKNILRPTNLSFNGYQWLFSRGTVFC
jgi:hypothetical protein